MGSDPPSSPLDSFELPRRGPSSPSTAGATASARQRPTRSLPYQLLNLVQITLAGLFQVLLARSLGAASGVDAYFVAITILTTLANLGNFFCDTFLQLYHDVRVKDPREAIRFYKALLNLSVVGGSVLFVGTRLAAPWLVWLFGWGLEPAQHALIIDLMRVMSLSLVVGTAARVNGLFLNAEAFFAFPYLVSILAQALNLSALVLLGRTYGIYAVAVGYSASAIAGFLSQQWYISTRLRVHPGLRLWHTHFRELARTSFSVRLAHQIYMLKDLIVTGFLSLCPPGSISLFNYAFRLSRVLLSIANTAALQVFSATNARAVAERRFPEVLVAVRRLMLQNLLSLTALSVPIAILLPNCLGPLMGWRLSTSEIRQLWILFVATLPYHLILAVELPLVQTAVSLKKGLFMVRTNAVFLAVYALMVIGFRNPLGTYAVSIALSLAQALNAATYFRVVRRTLKSATYP